MVRFVLRRYYRWRYSVYHEQHDWRSPDGRCKPNLEWSFCRNPLRLESAVHHLSALGVDSDVAAIDSRDPVEPWGYRQLRFRVSLQPIHDQPRGICDSQRVLVDTPARDVASDRDGPKQQ